MAEEIKKYKGRYTGPQIDDLLGRVPTIEQRVTALESGATGGDKNQEIAYTFSTPSSEWVCQHNLGKKPAVTVLDSGGNTILCDIRYIDNDSIAVTFGMNATGRIILN